MDGEWDALKKVILAESDEKVNKVKYSFYKEEVNHRPISKSQTRNINLHHLHLGGDQNLQSYGTAVWHYPVLSRRGHREVLCHRDLGVMVAARQSR